MREFGLLGFIEELAVVTAELVVTEHESLERAAVIVETEAKDAIGEYQATSGPFAAWPELTEATKADRVRQGYAEDEPELRTGELRDSIHHVVIGREAHIGSDNPIMEYQELGTAKIPPRSILGGAAVRKTNAVGREIGEAYVATLTGGQVARLPRP